MTQHITNPHNKIKTLKSGLIESDPIYEEMEIEDDDYQSENNFYTNWENHKRKLLTQDEQMKLFNADAHSSTGIFQKSKKKSSNTYKIGSRKGRRKTSPRTKEKPILAPIEEKKDDPLEEDHD